MFGDYLGAKNSCAWGKRYRIEDYVRTEAGNEIIWCHFAEGLDLVSHNQRPNSKDPGDRTETGIAHLSIIARCQRDIKVSLPPESTSTIPL